MLLKAAPASLAVVPFIRVYRDRADYGTWHRNPEIVAMIEREFTQGNMAGKVRGIGEFHLYGDEAKSKGVLRRSSPLRRNIDLWLHAHSDEAAIAHIFAPCTQSQGHLGAHRFQCRHRTWAALVVACGLMGELSYRNDITDGGKLSAVARTVHRIPDRFLLGPIAGSPSAGVRRDHGLLPAMARRATARCCREDCVW